MTTDHTDRNTDEKKWLVVGLIVVDFFLLWGKKWFNLEFLGLGREGVL
jgi:hypothetical protein